MADNDYKRYEPIDGKWRITRELGRGAYGTVFEIERKDFSNMKSALKVISIPNNENELRSYREDNYDLDEQSVTSYFYGFVEEFIKEFQIMSKLRGHSNIVSYEDHDVVKRSEGIGWDIFIRMELLTPMNQYFSQHAPNSQDVIKLGIDICKALEVCRNHNIIHRDIKPSNIFMSDIGDFKLGDFGVARTLEKTSGGLSQKGTYTYMAPEIYKGQEYNASVDIYSLGIVMYRLLNNNMEPFRTDRTFANGESAMARRMTGEPIPRPANAGDELARIIMKACAYSPQDRYSNAKDMRSDLERLLKRKKSSVFIGINPVNTGYPNPNPNLNPNQNPNLNREEKNTQQKKEKRTNTSGNNKGKKGIRVTICILCIIAVIAGIGIAAYKIIGSHTDGEENSHIENKIVSDDIELELEDGSKKAILDVLSLESEADINAESSNTDVVQIVNEDGEIYILCSDVGSAEVTYEYSTDTSKKETNIYSGTIKVTVVMSEKEKKEVEEGQAELDTLLSEANAVLEKAQNDNTVNHDHFTNEENELTSAINNFKEKAESTERSDDVKAAKQYYTDTVQPAVDNMNTAYNTAVQIAADEAAAKSAAANSAAGKNSSSGNTSSASGNKSSNKSTGGTSSNRSTNTQSGKGSSGSTSSGRSPSGGASSGSSSSGSSSGGSASSSSSGGSTSSGSSSGGSSASHGSQYGDGGQYD